jgi:predicted protein tyrosine phosphatase
VKRTLFLCRQNKLRSPTAESILCNEKGWSVRSAGLNSSADIEWAEYILVTEQAYKSKHRKKFKSLIKDKTFIHLDRPDNYEHMNQAFISILESKVPVFVP